MRATCAALLTLVAVAVTAQASRTHRYHHNPSSHRIYIAKNLKDSIKVVMFRRAIQHDRWVLKTAGKHKAKAVSLHWQQKRWMTQRLKHAEYRIHLRAAARWGPYAIPPAWWINDALCVHRGEGAWNDYGDPYWGGMQMDRNFMGTYGSWAIGHYGGFANKWPARIQLAVSYRAWRTRGWYPWPNTARACGLL